MSSSSSAQKVPTSSPLQQQQVRQSTTSTSSSQSPASISQQQKGDANSKTLSPGPAAAAVGFMFDGDGLVLRNRLAESQSPYVRGHMNNPVRWQMWNEEALNMAREHNRMVFLSVGYAACHWCHVMERESFENEEVAKVLNDNFIPIKVDREERPDIDRIYMDFVQATTGSGGWPLNVFLTPDLKPIFGGTYWPGPNTSTPSLGEQMGFLDVLHRIVVLWHSQRDKMLESANEIVKSMKDFSDEGLKGTGGEQPDRLEIDLLEETYQHFRKRYDPVYAGFGLAPKFPTPVNLEFLLRLGTFQSTVQDVVGDIECETAKDMALSTLKQMANGGIHDHIGHGFARYSVTADWSLPHFEKMLYDNAQLLSVYLDAYLLTGDKEMLAACIDCGDYLVFDRLHRPGGGFYSSEDADSYYRKSDTEKREGAFYVWTRKEFDQILGEQAADIVAKYWNVRKNGNVDKSRDAHDEFIHQNVLAVSTTPAQLAQSSGLPETEILKIIETARTKLREHREKERVRPNLDDKVVTAWNGLAIAGLARAGASLAKVSPEKAKAYTEAAVEAAKFIQENLYDEKTGLLKRVYRDGPGQAFGFADDYAFLISGLIELYENTFYASYLNWADALQKKQIELFHDTEIGGFFSTAKDSKDLILRLKDGLDNQEPSTNGVTATNLRRLSALLGDEKYLELSSKTIHAFSAEILQHPFLFISMHPTIVAINLGTRSVTLAGANGDPAIQEQLEKVRSAGLHPDVDVLFIDMGKWDDKDQGLRWLATRNPVVQGAVDAVRKEGAAFIEVCAGGRCERVNSKEKQNSSFAMGDVLEVLKSME